MPLICRCSLPAIALAAFFAALPLQAHEGAPCVDGFADVFPCHEVDMAHRLDIAELGGSGSTDAADIWGWTDAASGREFALVGLTDATAFVEVTDPYEPVYLGSLPTHSAQVNVWRDVKTYADHAFVVADYVSGHGMQVFDLTQLLSVAAPPVTFTETGHYPNFQRAHNIVINEDTGTAYAVGTDTCSGGLHMIDVTTPASPSFLGCFSADGYTHDAQCVSYAGPDADYQGREVCFNSNEDTLTIADVTNKALPVQISRTGYTGNSYAHQGWLTEDHAYFLLDDEIDEQTFGHHTKTYVWDLADLDAPSVMATYLGPSTASDHNLYVKGGFAYQANYRSGLRILDLADVASGQLSEVAFFDTYPSSDNSGYAGAWSNYPYFASGTVVVSDIQSGLFVLVPTSLCTVPVAVAGLVAAAAGDNRIDLTWSDDAGAGETYRVYRAFGGCPGSGFELIAEGLTGGAYSDLGVAGGVEYAYEVRKVDATGGCESAAGASCSSATTTGVCNAPPLFGGLTSVTDPGAETCRLDLAWDAGQPNCGAGVTYSVYRALTPGFIPDPTNRVAQDVTATDWSDGDVAFGTTYRYVARATDDGSGVEDSNLVELAGTPTGPAADATWATGAELGDPALIVGTGFMDPMLKHAGWHMSDVRVHSGERSFFSGYSNGLCAEVMTPPLALSAGEASELAFWTVYEIEVDGGGLAYDGGVLEISSDGATWDLLDLTPGYPTTWRSSSDACGFATGTPAFSGTDFVWGRYAADLSLWAGQTVQVRWRFSTDDFETREGWYVDDIEVTHVQLPGACSTVTALIFADGFESGDTSAW